MADKKDQVEDTSTDTKSKKATKSTSDTKGSSVKDAVDTTKKVVAKASEKVKEVAGETAKKTVKAATKTATVAKSVAQDVADTTKKVVAKASEKVKEVASETAQKTAKTATKTATVAKSVAHDVADTTKKVASKTVEKVKEVANDVKDATVGLVTTKKTDEVVATASQQKQTSKKEVDSTTSDKAEKPAPVKEVATSLVSKDAPVKATVSVDAKTVETLAIEKNKVEQTKKSSEPKPVVVKPKSDRGRLKRRYDSEVLPALQKELGLKNPYQVPKLVKIILNMRLGDIKDNSKSVQAAVNELTAIAGQKAIVSKAKKSVANFKVRENQIIGAKVTLRGANAYEFLDKLVSIVLPRVRDFRGVSDRSFDGRGNYSMGVKEHLIFPEISYELIEKVRGLDIAIVTTASNDSHAKAFLTKMGMPFIKRS